MVFTFTNNFPGESVSVYIIGTVHTCILIRQSMYTVTSDLSDTGLSRNLIYPTLCCESPSLNCTQFYLIYPTPGLSNTWFIRHIHGEQMPSDKPDPTAYSKSCSICTANCSFLPSEPRNCLASVLIAIPSVCSEYVCM